MLRSSGSSRAARLVSSRRFRRASALRAAPEAWGCQALESRTLLAIDIQWTNRATTDNFATWYGATAATARSIVDRAIASWEEVITSFNRSGGSQTYSLTVTAAQISGRGSTSITGTTNSKPSAASITLDDNGQGAGWYFDPLIGADGIPDDGEFTTLLTPYTADGAVSGADFYRTITHEIGHAMGIYNGGPLAAFLHDVGDDPNSSDAADRLLGVDIGNNGTENYTLTSNGGGHLFEGGGTYGGPVHPNDLMNAGRTVGAGRREIITQTDLNILAQGLGYSVVAPVNTFYANLNRTTDVLTVSGDASLTGSDNDTIHVSVSGTNTIITANGTSESIPNAEYTTLNVNAGNGSDFIYIDSLPAGKTVTVNGDAGNDHILLANANQDIDSDIDSDVSINGGTGTDSISGYDANDGINADTYTFNETSFIKGGRTFSFGALESITVNGSAQANVWNVNGTAYTLVINGGTAAETFNVGGGDIDSNIGSSSTTINGGGGTDSLVFDDTADGVGSDSYVLDTGILTKGVRTISYGGMASLVVNASNQLSTFSLNGLGSGVPAVINGGTNDETFNVGAGDLDSNFFSNVTVNGGGGTDSITFDDTADGVGVDTYTLSVAQVDKAGRTFNYGGFESFLLNGSPQPSTYAVDGSNGTADSTINGGAGDDTFTVGGGDVDTNMGAAISVNGGGGADSLIMDDTADAIGADTATFTVGQIVKGLQTFNYGSFATLVWNGAAIATAYSVDTTSAATPITINGGAGNDSVTVGGGDFDSRIFGDVQVSAAGGTDRLTIDDTADDPSVVDTNQINSTSYTKSSSSASVTWGGLLIFGSTGLEEFVLNGSGGASTVNVNSTGTTGLALPPNPAPVFPVAVTVNAGDGVDAINVTSGGQLTSIRGNIVLNGEGGVDSLLFSDTGDTSGDTFTMTQNTLANSNWNYTATFGTVEAVTLEAGSGNNGITYNATAAAPSSVNLNGNGGVDTYTIVEGVATLHGGAGLDNVTANSDSTGTGGFVIDQNEDWNTLTMLEGSVGSIAAGSGKALDVTTFGTIRGTFDVKDNYLVVRSPVASFLLDKIRRGYNTGGWNGVPAGGVSGVITSGTAAASTLGDALGYATIGAGAGQLNRAVYGSLSLSAGDYLIAHTLAGDTDIDRDVDFNDLLSLAKNYNGTSKGWLEGDADYNGTIGFADLLALAKNYNQSLPAPAAPAAAEGGGSTAASIGLSDDSASRNNLAGSLAEDLVA